jgi:hypothetical protein
MEWTLIPSIRAPRAASSPPSVPSGDNPTLALARAEAIRRAV